MEPNTANERRLNEARVKYYATKKHFEAAKKHRDAARVEYLVLLKDVTHITDKYTEYMHNWMEKNPAPESP